MKKSIDKELLEIIACPACKGELYVREPESIVCRQCFREYPVSGGVPILVIEKAVIPGNKDRIKND